MHRVHFDQYQNQIDYYYYFFFLQPKVENLYTVSKNKTWSWLWLRSRVLIAKFRLKLKKVEKTSRTFRYELNQIPYDHTLKVMNRFNVLDLTDRMPEELWRRVSNTVQEAVTKTTPKKRQMQDSKVVVWGGLTNSWGKKKNQSKGEKESYAQLNTEFQRLAKRNKKAFLNEQCKK